MKTPSEVINSDNSARIDEMKAQVVDVCDIMFKSFEDAVERSCKNFDRTVVAFGSLPDFSYYRDFCSMIESHFLDMIGEWSKYAQFKIEDDCSIPWRKNFEIICKYDTKNKCYIEVERNK